jgi:hypothetical protein
MRGSEMEEEETEEKGEGKNEREEVLHCFEGHHAAAAALLHFL